VLLHLRRDVRAADGGTAGGVLLEQGAPGREADDSVHLEPGARLVRADRGVGLRAEHAVGAHVKRLLDMRDELALAAHLEWQAALADLDRAVGGRLGGHGGAQVARRRHLRGGEWRTRAGHHGGGQRG
jgi:hypothetical protein